VCILSGILQYYLLTLTDVMQYADLKSEVFQGLKEFGNTVIFCRLIEQAFVSWGFFLIDFF
jgi:cytoplasmic FMR1 interacting protein